MAAVEEILQRQLAEQAEAALAARLLRPAPAQVELPTQAVVVAALVSAPHREPLQVATAAPASS